MTLVSAKPTDAALMQEVQAGRPFALGELYDRFSSRAYRTAFSVCHDRDCAQDAVQDAFVSIWSSRMTYQPTRGPVVRWAMTIVRHRAIYLARRQSATAGLDEGTARIEEQPAQDDVPTEFDARAKARELMRLLARLPPAQREVIRLAFFDGLTHREIARRLALPPGTVKGRMRLGLSKLRSELE
ncbi:MAG TPA: sigma-70 family RNA polymerase sigma factor [Solirubrobacteraceae bacterium]|jgi:RNA polymerase sigma-70 factor (ECF subfamily)